jgi:hypothetical protein
MGVFYIGEAKRMSRIEVVVKKKLKNSLGTLFYLIAGSIEEGFTTRVSGTYTRPGEWRE